MGPVAQLVFKTSAVVQPTAGLFPRFAFARARGSRAPRARIGWRSWELYFVCVLLRRGRAAPPADAFNPQCFTPPLTTSLRRGAAWARWPSWSSKPVRSCSPRPAFSLASRSLALGARALRALASAGARGSSISSAFCCGAAEPRLRPTPSTRSALHHRSRLAFDAERHGPGGPAGLQNQCGRAAHGSVGSTPAPLRSRVKDGAIVLPSGL